jgi:hypothetical protein
LLFIELIQFLTEDEGDHENERDEDERDGDGDDEVEDKQYRKRLSIDTKTDDAKCKDVVNRLRFMKLKKLKNIPFEKKSFFFRDADSISRVACPDRGKRGGKRGVFT